MLYLQNVCPACIVLHLCYVCLYVRDVVCTWYVRAHGVDMIKLRTMPSLKMGRSRAIHKYTFHDVVAKYLSQYDRIALSIAINTPK